MDRIVRMTQREEKNIAEKEILEKLRTKTSGK